MKNSVVMQMKLWLWNSTIFNRYIDYSTCTIIWVITFARRIARGPLKTIVVTGSTLSFLVPVVPSSLLPLFVPWPLANSATQLGNASHVIYSTQEVWAKGQEIGRGLTLRLSLPPYCVQFRTSSRWNCAKKAFRTWFRWQRLYFESGRNYRKPPLSSYTCTVQHTLWTHLLESGKKFPEVIKKLLFIG